MRYLTTLHVTAQPLTPPPTALFEAIAALGAEAGRAGTLLDFAGLVPLAAGGARLALVGDALTVTDGPFAETKELISYAVYEVRSRDEAVEWARRFLQAHQENWPGWEGEVDVQQFIEAPAA
jgi:hypothetical protein